MTMKQLDAIGLLNRYELPHIKDMQVEDDIIEWVAAFIGSDSFQNRVEAFCNKHIDSFSVLQFSDSVNDMNTDHERFSAWHEIHEQFNSLCSSSVEEFLNGLGYTLDTYQMRCQEAVTLSEERQRHSRLSFLAQLLSACTEYDQFLNLMRRAVDPDYEYKRELAIAAEQMAQEDPTPSVKNHALEFLAYYQANPASKLEELTQKFHKFASIA